MATEPSVRTGEGDRTGAGRPPGAATGDARQAGPEDASAGAAARLAAMGEAAASGADPGEPAGADAGVDHPDDSSGDPGPAPDTAGPRSGHQGKGALASAGAAAARELAPTPPVDADTRRRLDAMFGDALPAVTSDELGLDDPDRVRRTGSEADARLLADRPPHHDRG